MIDLPRVVVVVQLFETHSVAKCYHSSVSFLFFIPPPPPQECDYKHESFGGGAPIALYHLCNLYTSSKKTKNDTRKYHGVGSDEVTNDDPFIKVTLSLSLILI